MLQIPIIMKKLLLFVILFSSIFAVSAQKFYSTTGGEIIFSNAFVEMNGDNVQTNYRFTLFYHMETNYHWDFAKFIGMYFGLGIRNVGLITEEDYKKKHRSYMLGIPLALKLGRTADGSFLYGGAEYEMLFHYKEKTFENDTKTKYTEWFSDRTNRFLPSVFFGYQFKGGTNLRFKMYLENFFNQDYSETIDNVETYPYQNVTSQIYYFSLSFYLKNKRIREQIEKRNEFFVRM